MALTGAFLILFVTFHVLMNGVALFWPTAYNAVCEFLGANWYALVGTAILAGGFVLHILYALWLTYENRRARGGDRYAVTSRPKQVEWSSKNMLVLGIVVVCFMIVHLYQFWAKMQLPEVLGLETQYPAAAGTLYIQQAFSCPVTLIIYLIGFGALWLHMTHGFWSMCQSSGLNNGIWMNRLKNIGCVWATVVVLLFAVEAIVFTVQSKSKFYTTDKALLEQYQEMLPACVCESCDDCSGLDCASADCKSDCPRHAMVANIVKASCDGCDTPCCGKANDGCCAEKAEGCCDKAACLQDGNCADCPNASNCNGDCKRNCDASVSDNFNNGTF